MNYSQLVDSYIKESGLSLGEIAKRMNLDKGVKIDRSYISKLRNDPKYPASEEINRALAEVTGGDSEKLIQAAYMEKAPTEMQKEFKKMQAQTNVLSYLISKSNLVINDKSNQSKEESIDDFLDYFLKLSDEEKAKLINTSVSKLYEEEQDEFLEVLDQLTDTEDNVSTLYNLRKKHKKTIRELADYLDITPAEYVGLEARVEGKDIKISSNYPDLLVLKLANYYNVDTSLLLEDLAFLYNGSDKNGIFLESNLSKVPVLGMIRAGQPIDRIEYNEGYTLVDPERIRGREVFALRVKGDSMSGDRIKEGDIVIVVKQEEVQPHEIAVVAVDGDYATLKRVKPAGDMCMLIPSNPTMSPELVPCKDVKIIGKVIEVKFFLD